MPQSTPSSAAPHLGWPLGTSCSPSFVGGEVLLSRRDATVIMCPREGRGIVAGGGSSRCIATKSVGPASDCASKAPSASLLSKLVVSPVGLRTNGRLAFCLSPPGPRGAVKTRLREAAGTGEERAWLCRAQLWAQGLPLTATISDRCSASVPVCFSIPTVR